MTMTDPSIRNGVDTATLFATLDAVREQPEAAAFKFRVSNRWISGTHSQGTVDTFFGVGEERGHNQPTVINADHPEVLVGKDNGPDPGGVRPRRPGRLPHRRHRQHRRRPGHRAHEGRSRPSRPTST